MKRNFTALGTGALALLGIGIVGGGVLFAKNKPRQVEITLPQRKLVVESISASGRLRGEVETSVGAATGGRVIQLFVKEGQRVHKGQLLAQLDNQVLEAQRSQSQSQLRTFQEQIAQAQSSVRTAEAQLRQAQRGPLEGDVARLKADVAQNIAVAETKVTSSKSRLAGAEQKLLSAQQRLAELKAGSRIEEIEQAEAQVRQSEANLTQAKRDNDRQSELLAARAIPRNQAEQAQTQLAVAEQTLESHRARLRQLKSGTRPEQLRQSEADVAAAESEVRTASAEVASAQASRTGSEKSGQAQLRSLLASPRPEDVAVAAARLEDARRAESTARQRLSEASEGIGLSEKRLLETRLLAPFDGTVTQILTEEGGIISPTSSLLKLTRLQKPEIKIDVDEVNLGRLRVGQDAEVTSDAYPGQSFPAKVTEVGTQVDTDRGTVEVRLTPINPPRWIRSGQTLSVNLIVEAGKEQLVVPVAAVSTMGDTSTALIIENGKVAKRKVKIGAASAQLLPIREGLSESDKVILGGADLKEGQAVIAKEKTR
ncbi:efflux RND transporter periplasmic adaptor subunit [Armatimonas sp.]|uniref:efflux RND transporter periplasmic adaptor subunit n=1 Tax=Armatimonas sp. TaxID=1872638 RepID=UPI00286B1888|nr:efflux RND transporter periplasmic adaptor subunit [Armatimonas sp.]